MARCENYVSKRVYKDLAKRLNAIQDELGFGELSTIDDWWAEPEDARLRFASDCCSPWGVEIVDGQWKVALRREPK